jgi:hypothetical protein
MSNFSETIELNGNTPYDIILDDVYAPFTLTISPEGLYGITDKKVRAIEYIWGDGEKALINYKATTSTDINLVIFDEAGTPLNYPQTHNFYFKDLNLSVYNIKVNIYFFGTSTISSFNINLNLKNPDIIYGVNSYFSEFHLIKTRMFDANDTLLYVFQTQEPNYILMSSVNWTSTISTQTIESIPIKSRPYEFNDPIIAKKSYIPINNGINVVPYIESPISIINGGN